MVAILLAITAINGLKCGVFDEKIAKSFKENILEKGGSSTMQELFINFMGRKPDEQKLLELMGMK